eukprot:9374645-Karenia_brevis.AAC.1
MQAQAGTPKGWHTRWVSVCKLQPTDSHVSIHEAMCHLLELMVSYDQLDASNLACAEVACRQIQFAEEKWKERVVGQQGEELASS